MKKLLFLGILLSISSLFAAGNSYETANNTREAVNEGLTIGMIIIFWTAVILPFILGGGVALFAYFKAYKKVSERDESEWKIPISIISGLIAFAVVIWTSWTFEDKVVWQKAECSKQMLGAVMKSGFKSALSEDINFGDDLVNHKCLDN